MKSITRIAYIIMSLICFQLQTNAQNLPLVCGGSRARYGVTGEAGSTYEWQIVGGLILNNYNDSIDVQWFNNDSVKSLSASEHTNTTCFGSPAIAFIPASAPRIELGSDLIICANKLPYQFKSDIDTTQFKLLWSTGNTTKNIYLTKQGIYSLSITDVNGCSVSDSINLSVLKSPVVELAQEIKMEKDPVILDAGTDGILYSWWDYKKNELLNENKQTLEIKPGAITGNYLAVAVVVTNIDGCTTSDSTKVYGDPSIPNAFTPNDDNDNDTWKLNFLVNYPKATVEIFDRWGRRVFHCGEGQFPSEGWDGNQNGKKLPMDNYFYVIKLNDGSDPITKGVTIIR